MSNPESPRRPSTGASSETSEQKIARPEEENGWFRQRNTPPEEQDERHVKRIEALERHLESTSRNSGK